MEPSPISTPNSQPILLISVLSTNAAMSPNLKVKLPKLALDTLEKLTK